MKKHINFYMGIGIICLIMLQVGYKPANETSELQTLASIIEGENIMIQEWSIHSREKLEKVQTDRDLESYIESLQNKFPQWDWTVSETETVGISSESAQKETIKVVTTHTNHNHDAYVIYEVKGKSWNAGSERFFQEEFSAKLDDIFHEKTTIFSCIKGEFNDKIEKTLNQKMLGLLKAFDAQEVESLKEASFFSVSAKSPKFTSTIQSKNDEINLQIGLRTQGMGAKTTLVVGTPIITIEY